MQLLLDTHTIIWYVEDDPRLPGHIRRMLKNDFNDIYVSLISFWEISIKSRLGKLSMSKSLADVVSSLDDNYFQFLTVHLDHIFCLNTLELHHKDPFDRMLLAQALAEDFALVSCDDVFDQYEIQRFW